MLAGIITLKTNEKKGNPALYTARQKISVLSSLWFFLKLFTYVFNNSGIYRVALRWILNQGQEPETV